MEKDVKSWIHIIEAHEKQVGAYHSPEHDSQVNQAVKNLELLKERTEKYLDLIL